MWEKGKIDIDSAITNCLKAIELAPDNIDAKLYLGYFYRAEGDFDKAIEQFNQAAQISFAKSGKARLALGVSTIQKSRKHHGNLKELTSGLFNFTLGLCLISIDFKTIGLITRSLVDELKTVYFKIKGYSYELIGSNRLDFKEPNTHHFFSSKIPVLEFRYPHFGKTSLF